MAGLVAVVDQVIDDLTAADVSATPDVAELHPPAVLVGIDSLTNALMLDGSGPVVVRLNLCAPNVGWRDALAALDGLLAAVRGVIDMDSDVFPETLLIEGVGELPSLRATATYF